MRKYLLFLTSLFMLTTSLFAQEEQVQPQTTAEAPEEEIAAVDVSQIANLSRYRNRYNRRTVIAVTTIVIAGVAVAAVAATAGSSH